MKNKILVLDDDADILDINLHLTGKRYEVVTLLSVEEIVETIRRFHPDLILMDVMLGNMDGRVICSDIKHNNETQNLPVILISASHNLAQSLLQDGAPDDFIAKPFDIDKLIQKVEQQLAA